MTLNNTFADERSGKIIDLSKQMSAVRLEELRAKRELELMKAKLEYYVRINKSNEEDITKLEKEISGHELKFNERENFWRDRYNQQLKLVFKDENMDMSKLSKDGKSMTDEGQIRTLMNKQMTYTLTFTYLL